MNKKEKEFIANVVRRCELGFEGGCYKPDDDCHFLDDPYNCTISHFIAHLKEVRGS